MASFCAQCGFPLESAATFCPRCGTARSGMSNAPPPQQMMQPAGPTRPAAKSNTGTIIVVIVLVCVGLAGAAAYTVMSFVHRAERAVVAKAATYGVDLKSHPSKSSSTNASRTAKGCDLISKDMVAQALGQPIEKMEQVKDEPGTCVFSGPPGLAVKLAKEDAETAYKRAQQPGASPSEGVEMARGITGVIGGPYQTSGGEAPLLIFVITRGDGRTQMTALTINKAMFGKIPGTFEDVPGLGDRAILAPPLGLNVLKGDSLIRIVVAPMTGSREKAVALARAILPNV